MDSGEDFETARLLGEREAACKARPWQRAHFAVDFEAGDARVQCVPGRTEVTVRHPRHGERTFVAMLASAVVAERELRITPRGVERWWAVSVALAASPNTEHRFSMRALDVRRVLDLLREHVGAVVLAEHERSAEAMIRVALEHSASLAPEERVYSVTGWAEHEGEPFSLHAGGATGAHGAVPGVRVDLSAVEGAERFVLPAPPEGAELRAAVGWALRALRMKPSRVALPLFLAPFAAALGLHRFALSLTAPMRTGKSAWASIAQRFHGATFDSQRLAFSWRNASAAGLWPLLSTVRHAFVVGDDFQRGYCPEGVLDTVNRGVVDGLTPRKATRGGEARRTAPLGAALGGTFETTPDNASGASRWIALELPERSHCEPAASFLEVDAAAARGELAACMAAFLRDAAATYGGPLTERDEGVRAHVAHFRKLGHDDRASKQLAQLARAAEAFGAFAQRAGVLDAQGAADLLRDALEALDAAGHAQRSVVSEATPAAVYLAALRAMLASGAAHVRRIGTGPELGPEWGHTPGEGTPRTPRVGWHDTSEPDRVYFDPKASVHAVQRWCREAGESFHSKERELGRILHEAGALAAREGTKDMPYKRRRQVAPGVREATFCVLVAALRGESATPPETAAEDRAEVTL